MTSIIKWKVFCDTENTYVYTYTDSGHIPTHCHNNTEHVVTQIPQCVSVITENQFKLKEEDIPTQGYFRLEGDSLECPPNTVSVYTKTNNYDMAFYAFYLVTTAENYLDVININIIIGPFHVLQSDLPQGSTTLQISPVVAASMPYGFEITIDGVFVAEILEVNSATGVITFNSATTQLYTAGKVLLLRNRMVKNFVIGGVGTFSFGLSRVGGSHFKKTYTLALDYHNKSPVLTKNIAFYGELSF